MNTLFTTPGQSEAPCTPVDPRTSFREIQAQDAVLWSKTIYEAYFKRAMGVPQDHEAIEWFQSDSKERFTFLQCCSIFGIDSERVRDSINQTLNKGKNHE